MVLATRESRAARGRPRPNEGPQARRCAWSVSHRALLPRAPPSPRPTCAQPKAAKAKKAAPAPTPYDAPKAAAEDKSGPIWEKKPKNFSIGGDVRVKTDVGRFVAWPKYVRLQRQRKILYQRLKVPPAINQFSVTLEKQAGALRAGRACARAAARCREARRAPRARRAHA